MRLLALCSSTTVWAAGVLAQSSPANLQFPGIQPYNFTVATFGRSVVADLTGHQLPDVVVLATEANGALRETALLVGAPGIHSSAVVLKGSAGKKIRDVAVIQGGDRTHARDALLLATDQGLYRWFANGQLTQCGGANWNNATRVEVGDVDGDGYPDAVGKMGGSAFGNPQNLRVTSIGGSAAWLLNTGAPVLDLAVVDWVAQSGAARDEVAFVHGNAVHFVVDGAIVPSLSVTLPLSSSARLVAIRAADGTPRLVAALTDATGASQLATITPGSSVVAYRPVGRPIGSLTVVQNSTGADGVVVAIAENANLTHFAYDPATFPVEGFGVGTALRAAASPANGSSDGRLLDLDRDGDLDLVAPKVGSGIVVSRTAGPAPGTDGRPILIELSPNEYTLQVPTWATEVETLHYQFTTTWNDTAIAGLSFNPACVVRSSGPVGATFVPGDQWPTSGDLATGPVVTLFRAVERAPGGEITRLGPFRGMIWTMTNDERVYLANLLAGHSMQPQPAYVNSVSTPNSLVYSGVAPGAVIVYPNTNTGAPHFGIIPGAVEPPVLPPPDVTDPPEGDPVGTGD